MEKMESHLLQDLAAKEVDGVWRRIPNAACFLGVRHSLSLEEEITRVPVSQLEPSVLLWTSEDSLLRLIQSEAPTAPILLVIS